MTTAVLAEDEDILRVELQSRLAEVWPTLQIVASVDDGAAALEEIFERKPDIAFLDIRMPGLTGLDVAAALAANGSTTQIVFVTAFEQHAIEAFERGAVDYLLKPVTAERLQQTVARLQARSASPSLSADALTTLAQALRAQPTEPKTAPIRWIVASSGTESRMILVEDILYIQADNKYCVVMTAEGESLIRKPIKELTAGLDAEMFWQIHRGTIVNIRAMKSLTRDDAGRGVLKLKQCAHTLAVSQPFMHLFRGM
ncbi:MAG: response regulator transcription factor [Rhodoferax sp.]|nr:response regulator transcription factor [Rhodoferax sp.]